MAAANAVLIFVRLIGATEVAPFQNVYHLEFVGLFCVSPSAAKAAVLVASYGTAEAVPFPSLFLLRTCRFYEHEQKTGILRLHEIVLRTISLRSG